MKRIIIYCSYHEKSSANQQNLCVDVSVIGKRQQVSVIQRLATPLVHYGGNLIAALRDHLELRLLEHATAAGLGAHDLANRLHRSVEHRERLSEYPKVLLNTANNVVPV